MDHEELRLKAMGMALQSDPGLTGSALIERAEGIYQWLRYGSDGATDTRKALDGITLTDAKTGATRPAKVVGRNEDIIDRLRKEDGYEKE